MGLVAKHVFIHDVLMYISILLNKNHTLPLRRVCSGPRDRRDKATQITTTPTIMTTTVAPMGTTMLRSSHSGTHGKYWFTDVCSCSGGAMVPTTYNAAYLSGANSCHAAHRSPQLLWLSPEQLLLQGPQDSDLRGRCGLGNWPLVQGSRVLEQ
jgi:hypothetical protein